MKKKLKIAMFFSSDPAHAGGVQEHIFYLSKYLSKLGHKIDIYGPQNNRLNYKNYHGISKVITLPLPNGDWSNITIPLENINEITKKIYLNNYNVLHIHEPYIPFVNWNLIGKNKITKVATFHSAWNKYSLINLINPMIPLFKNLFSDNFKGAIFVSKTGIKRWKEICGRNILKRVIHNGIDNSLKPSKEKTHSNSIRILFLGRLVYRKGIHYLLKSFKKLIINDSNIRLIIVGDGKTRKDLESYCRKNKMLSQVHFVGEVFGKEKIQYYQEADIFCAPYFDEAFGITIIEAMAVGVPIVGFKNESFREILKNYPYPELLVEPREVERLTEALKKIIDDKNMRQEISSWLVKESKKYSWEKIAKETEEFYYKSLGK